MGKAPAERYRDALKLIQIKVARFLSSLMTIDDGSQTCRQ